MEQSLYELPEGWEWHELVSLTSKIGSGATPRGGQKSYKSEGISLIRSLNVYDESFRKEGLAFIDEGQAANLSNVVVEKGDVLLNITGASIARCSIAPTDILPARVNQHVSIIRPKDNIEHRFLHGVLISPQIKKFLLNRGAGGATRQALTKTMIQHLQIPLPPLNEQKRIVARLDALFTRIDAAITHLQETLALSKALFASALDEEFSSVVDRFQIGEIAYVKGGKRLPKGKKLQDEPTSHPYIRVADFRDDGTIEQSKLKYVSDEIHEQIKRYTISSADLYISIAGTIGKTGVVPTELDGANLTENAAKIVFKEREEIDVRYVYFFTLSHDFSEQSGTATKVVAQPKLALTRLSKIEIPLPSLDEQKSIVTHLDVLAEHTRTLEAETQERLDQLNTLKSSLLDAAFRGQL